MLNWYLELRWLKGPGLTRLAAGGGRCHDEPPRLKPSR